MTHNIYIPRISVSMLLSMPPTKNPQICVKIPYLGFEISISLDSSHGDGDLFRGDIRVFDRDKNDVTADVLRGGQFDYDQTMIYGTAEDLQEVFRTLERYDSTGHYHLE